MIQFIIEIILGLISGIFLGITGVPPFAALLIILDYFNIGNYQSNLGSILLLSLFPITIGAVYEFYKANKINHQLSIILLTTSIIGSYIGAKMVVRKYSFLTIKNIKYITGILSIFIGIVFLFSAYNDSNK
jgi:uncharacterized membrane protein YfcA